MNYLDLTIKEIHEALVNKQVTPLELVNEALKRAKEDKCNAFEYIMEKEALSLAKTLTEPEKDNLLWGIPFAIKDNISTKGVPTCASSDILKGYVPIYNATIIEKLLKKKAIPFAKVTLDELAMGGTGATGHLGKTTNPYDVSHERMVGGSSCGSAAVVSSAIVPFALGSDTGDSIRKPASYAGLVGFKPTWGRISRYGLFPFTPSLDSLGFFTRSVYDSALILNIVAGYDKNDFTSSREKVDDYTSDLNKPIKGIKIAVIKEILESVSDPYIQKKFQETLKIYEELGAKINYVSVNHHLLKTLFPTYYIISCAEATSNNANLDGVKFGLNLEGNTFNDSLIKTRSEGFSERIKRRFVIGSYSLMAENQNELYLRATKNRHKIVDEINKVLKDNDVIFLPASPSVAPKFDNKIDQLEDEYLIADNYMVIANFAGLPSITIPTGFVNDLPFGFNLTASAFAEKKLFNIAKALEDKLGYYNLSARTKK
ncbi:MAG: aspartyl/glutamyl-tRNA amidotransferase subunit A [Bacilli bacterium]|nr:aspartyl/glutamyl-tRNA amidotransferase subunit A [Bacilli bacterium]